MLTAVPTLPRQSLHLLRGSILYQVSIRVRDKARTETRDVGLCSRDMCRLEDEDGDPLNGVLVVYVAPGDMWKLEAWVMHAAYAYKPRKTRKSNTRIRGISPCWLVKLVYLAHVQ